MIDPTTYRARIATDPATGDICLDNGLVRRTIRTSPACATVGFDQLVADRALIRACRPEGMITIGGVEIPIGGLTGSHVQNFLGPSALAAFSARR